MFVGRSFFFLTNTLVLGCIDVRVEYFERRKVGSAYMFIYSHFIQPINKSANTIINYFIDLFCIYTPIVEEKKSIWNCEHETYKHMA